MRTSLIFFTLVGFVACSSPWQVNQQYEYDYLANTLTGYGQDKNQYVGIITKGRVTLQPESDNVVRGKLSQVRHAHFHDELKDGLNSQIPEQGLNFSDEPATESLFSINYKNGVVKSLDVDQSLSNDDINQLKAVLSQLQVDTTAENVIKCRHNQLPNDQPDSTNAYYKTMEPAVTGECETLYEMSSVPAFTEAQPSEHWAPQAQTNIDENLIQFVKTVNFSNCDVRRGYHFGISGASNMKPNSNQMGEFLSKSAVSKVLVAGPLNRFTIKSAETINRVAVSAMLYDDEQAEVVSRIALQLRSVEPVASRLPVKSEQLVHVGNLVYRYNIPSDKTNQPRLSAKSATEALSSSSSSSSSEEQKRTNQRQRRNTNSENHIRQQTHQSSSSSSSSSESSEEYNSPKYSAKYPHHYQPIPEKEQAPEQPMQPFTVGNKGRSIQFHNAIDAVAESRKLADEISSDLQVQGEIPTRDTLEKYTILAELIQTMDYKQIEQMMQSRSQRQGNGQLGEQLADNTLLDATAQAGTNPAISWIVKAISNGQIRGSETAEVLETAFKNLRTPTESIVRDIFEKIIKNDQIRRQTPQFAKILITFSDLLRRSYSDKDYASNYFPVQSFGSFEKALGNIVTKEVIPWMGERLAENIKNKNQQRSQKYIRALGSVGHPKIVQIFEPYLEDEKRATSFERLSIVASFEKLVQTYPKYAQKILYKVYTNVAEEPEIRSLAVTILMRTEPPAAMLQRMAMSTYTDPSISVRTTVKSAINSAAQLNTHKNANLAANAKAAQQFLNPHTFGLQNSKTSLRDRFSEVCQISEEYQMTHIIGPDSTYPQVMSFTSWKSNGGIQTNEIDVQALVSSVHDVWNKLVSNTNSGNSASQKSKYSVQQIAKQLGVQFESNNDDQVAGQLLFKMLGRKNFFSFDKESLKEAPKMIATMAQELMSGRQLQYNKFYDHEQIVIAFPLATGYPFYYAYKNPILVQALGQIQAQTTPSFAKAKTLADLYDTEAINTTAKIQMTFSMEKIGKAGFITPFERQRYVAGQIQKMQVHLPFSLSLNLDLKNNAVSGKVAPLASENKVKLMHFSSWPFTLRKNALSLRPASEATDVKLIETRPTVGYEETVGEESIGMSIHLKAQHQFPQSSVNKMERLLQQEGVKQYAKLPMNIISAMQSLVNQQSPISPAQFIPFLFEPATQSTPTGNVLLSVLSMTFYRDLEATSLTKLRAAMSLASMPFVDASELKQTTLEQDVSANAPWPKSDIAHFKFTLTLDLQRSANQAIKFGIQTNNQQNINESGRVKRSDKPLSSADESKQAVVSDISPNSETRRQEMMWNAARDMKQADAALVDSALVFDGSKPAKFVGTIAQADNSVGDKSRVLVFGSAKLSSGNHARQVYASYVRNFANTPAMNYEEAEKHNGKSNAKLTVIFGEDGKPKDTKVNAKMVLEQSNKYKQQLRQTPVAKECLRQMREGNNQMPACLKATYEANILDQIRVNIETENPSNELKNFGHSVQSVLNHWGYYNGKHDHSQKGQSGRIEAEINIDPRQQTMNITLQLPSGQEKFTGLEIPRLARSLLAVHPGMNYNERRMRTLTRNSQVCVVDRNQILTFDNTVAEKQNIGKCWYAVVQHSDTKNPNNDHSILIREANEGNNKREVLIVSNGQRIQLSPSDDPNTPAKVTVNDKQQKVSDKDAIEVHISQAKRGNRKDNTPAARIYAISERNLKVELHGTMMKLYYDGERIRVHADPQIRGEVAGLCGNYNGEQFDDIANPQKNVLENGRYYTPAWAVPDDQCDSAVQEEHQKAQSARSYEVKFQAGNIISNFENGKRFEGKHQSDRKWQSSESSSSSSSESNENNDRKQNSQFDTRKKGNSACQVEQRVQFKAEGDKYCFTKIEVNACPNHCNPDDLTQIEVDAHCRNPNDSVAKMYMQQIRRGSNPDLSSKKVNKKIRIDVPRTCGSKQ